MIFASPAELAKAGILGMNQRNVDFIAEHNQRKYYPRVDDKLYTKLLAIEAGIAVPELYGVIEIVHQIQELPEFLSRYKKLVIKPSRGSGGDGILILIDRFRNKYRKTNGELIGQDELDHHISNILSGTFSLGGYPDVAMIEACVNFHDVFDSITYQGVPDIRIIVYQGVPAMAMIRLPTRMSGGKANLHQGAIGAGIDMKTGKTITAVWHNDIVDEHPDTHMPVEGVEIPEWKMMLEIATKSYPITKLGYIGVDIVLDRELGPLVLELNARPGLNIQIANRCGLLHRLKRIEEVVTSLDTIDKRVNFAIDNL